MKPNLAILLMLLPLTAGLAAKETHPAQNQPEAAAEGEAPSPAAILADQVREIASSATLSRKSQAKLITQAIRLAITTATEGMKDPADRLQLALELTTVAAKAAPQFAATITSAVAGLPLIAKIDGALDQIQNAVKKGTEAGEEPDLANPAVNPPRHENHEFDGPNTGGLVVSPSGPANSNTSTSSGSLSNTSTGATITAIGSK